MACASVYEGFWRCAKRWELERALLRSGHAWPTPESEAPMCGAECAVRFLIWLRGRGDADGGFAAEETDVAERAAGWRGRPGVLLACLLETGWVDPGAAEGTYLWHDFRAVNERAVSSRNARTSKLTAAERSALGAAAGRRSAEVRAARWGSAQPGADRRTLPNAPRTPSEPNGPNVPFGRNARTTEVPPNGPEPLGRSGAEDRNPPMPPRGGGADPKRVRRMDPLVSRLKNLLGSGAKVCADQIRALRTAGWDDAQIASAVGRALPGMSPWEWTRSVTGNGRSNGKPDLISEARRLDEQDRRRGHSGDAAGLLPDPPH